MEKEQTNGWAAEELVDVDLGDTRLNRRLATLCNSFSESPESPINQACEDWAETKAAYRFFRNDKVDACAIMKAHRLKTAERAKRHKTILAIQDTSYFIYTSHPKTKGLGRMSLKKGKHVEKIFSNGLVMHACLGVTTDGLPIGLLDQLTRMV
jgi:Transposase DNA-binding